jgi:cytidyltransferase-like protein
MIINHNELNAVRKNHKNQTIVIGLGSFDMFHWEHLQFLKDAKKLGDILVIAVKDNLAVSTKGANRPIVDESQRLEIIDSIKEVDYTILANERVNIAPLVSSYSISENKIEREWWEIFYPIFKNLQPDILHCEENHPVRKSRAIYLNKLNTKIITRKYRGLITTSKIIKKVKNNA